MSRDHWPEVVVGQAPLSRGIEIPKPVAGESLNSIQLAHGEVGPPPATRRDAKPIDAPPRT
jgi:hypothetical protein